MLRLNNRTTLLRRVKATGSIRTLLIVEDIAEILWRKETCRYVFISLYLQILSLNRTSRRYSSLSECKVPPPLTVHMVGSEKVCR